jgi:hypothetical protein
MWGIWIFGYREYIYGIAVQLFMHATVLIEMRSLRDLEGSPEVIIEDLGTRMIMSFDSKVHDDIRGHMVYVLLVHTSEKTKIRPEPSKHQA